MKTYSRKNKRSGATGSSACPSKNLSSSLPASSANQRLRSSGATSDRPLLGSQPSLTSPQPRPSSDPFAFLSSDEEGGNPTVRAPARGDGKTAASRKIATQARAGSAIASQPKGSKPSVDPWALDFTDDFASKNGSQSQHDPDFLRSLMASAESGDTSGDNETSPQPAVKRRSHSQSQSLSQRQSDIQLPRPMLPPPSLPRGWSADDPQIVRRVADRSEYKGPSMFQTTGSAAHRPLPVERPASREIPRRGSFPDDTYLGGSLPMDGPQAGGGFLTMIESQESVSVGIAKPHTNLRTSRGNPTLHRSGSAPSSQPSQYQPPSKCQHLSALAAHRGASEGRKPSSQRDSVQGAPPEKDTANGDASGNTFQKSKVEVAGRAPLQRHREVGSQGKNHSGTSSQGCGPKQASKRSAGGSGRVSGSSQRPTGVAAASAMLQRQKSGGPSTVAARTVVEAEESGEDTQLLDDALYALQGLSGSASPATRLDSALAMADIGATQRGRRTLRTAGVLQEVLAAASQLPLESEPLLSLALAALLAFFSQQAADQVVLSTPESLTVLAKLFLVDTDSETGSECETRVLKLVQSACGASEACCPSPAWVALSILAAATDPHRSPTTSDALKPLLRTSGLLDTLTDATVEGITQCCAPGGGGRDAADSDCRLQRRIQLLLVILENTTFACPENEEHLVSRPQTIMSSPPSGSASSQSTSFCGWLTAQLPEVGRAARDGRLPNGCMHSAVSVLMNVTHNSSVGREAVAAANGVEIVGRMMVEAACAQLTGCITLALSYHAPWINDCGRQEAEEKPAGEGVETLSELLGLLINLVEVSSASREQLLSLDLSETPSVVDGGTGTESEPQRVLPLLCQLMLSSPRHESEGANSGVHRLASDEMTEEQLDGREGAGDASILEVYVSMMLGFLVVDDPIRRREAEALLPGHSLGSVASAVERALHFYVNTGAITVQAEASLRQLVASLRA